MLAGAWGSPWRADCTGAGPWLAGCSGQALGGLAGPWTAGYPAGWSLEGCTASWFLEGWLCWAGPWRAGCAVLVPGGLVTLLVPVSPNMLKMCSFNSLRHGIGVEKQFSCSFKVQVLAVIYLNTQLKVHVDLVHIIFPQTEFSNTFHKYRSIKHSSKQSNKVAHKIYSI